PAGATLAGPSRCVRSDPWGGSRAPYRPGAWGGGRAEARARRYGAIGGVGACLVASARPPPHAPASHTTHSRTAPRGDPRASGPGGDSPSGGGRLPGDHDARRLTALRQAE